MAALRRPAARLLDARPTPRGHLTAPAGARRSRFGPSALAGFGFSCVLGLLAYLSSLQLQSPVAAPLVAPSAVPPTAALPRPDWRADFPERVEAVTAALSQLALPLPTPATVAQGAGALRWTHRMYDLMIPKPDAGRNLEQLLDPLRQVASGVSVQATQQADGARIQVGIDGLLTHTLNVRWLGHAPRAAIILGDLGSDLLVARALTGLQAPLTFAVRPGQPFSKEVAELAALFKREVLLQLPDDEDRLPGGALALPSTKQRTDVQRWLDQSLDSVPHSVGLSSKPTLLFAAGSESSQWTFDFLKDKHLFFVDTASAASGTCALATSAPVGCVATSVWLDAAAIAPQIEALIQTARTQGDAVAVGRASAMLATALGSALPDFAAAGVEVVPASVIVADRSLSPH